MGLLTRRRKPADRALTAGGLVPVTSAVPVTNAPPTGPAITGHGRDVIRPGDLVDVPAWSTLPPLASLLPPVPFVVSRHFDDDLVSWHAPELSLAPLGHAISTTAPSGVVQAMAVLSSEALVAEPVDPPSGPDATLSLVTPVGAPPVAGPVNAVRSTPGSVAASPTTLPRSAPLGGPPTVAGVAVSGVDPAARADPAAREDPADSGLAATAETGLVGDAPLAARPGTAGPAVVAVAAPVPMPLLEAPAPDLPLVQLPSARLAGSSAGPRTRPPNPTPPASRDATALGGPPAAAGQVQPVLPSGSTGGPIPAGAGLVGDRDLVPPTTPPAGGHADADRRTVEAPLPLAEPSEHSGRSDQPSMGRDGPEPAPVASTHPVPSASGEPATPSPPASSEPAATSHPEPVTELAAPLVGEVSLLGPGPSDDSAPDAPPHAGDTGVLPVARRGDLSSQPAAPPPRRAGLGQPLSGLPPTAASFDPLAPGRRISMGDAIRARTDRAASPGRPATPRTAPGQADPQPQPRGRTAPGRRVGLPLAPGSLPADTAGPAPGLLGTVSDSGYQALRPLPLVSIESVGPTTAGMAAADLAPPGSVGPLSSLRRSLLDATRPSLEVPDAPAEGGAARATVGQRHGLDLSQVPVDRSAAGAARARSLGARGYASHAGVVIPPDNGTLNAGPGQALLAHELTHIAQRARLGPNLPAEDTPAGQALEAEARSAELALAPSAPTRSAPTERHPRRSATQRPADGQRPSLPLAPSSGGRPEGAVNEASLLAAMQKLSLMGTPTPPGGGPTTVVMTPASVAAPPAPLAVQRALAPEAPPMSNGSAPAANPFSAKPSDADLSKLVRWIYPLISFRIRGELRENRERAGLLTDSYRRW